MAKGEASAALVCQQSAALSLLGPSQRLSSPCPRVQMYAQSMPSYVSAFKLRQISVNNDFSAYPEIAL